MRIIIEGYPYAVADVKDVLHGIDALENVEGNVSVNYVGYYYNFHINDCVFILPKVLLENKYGKDLVFGEHTPESIINLDANNPLTPKESSFIYEFAVWIYRAIMVFKNSHPKSDIVYHKKLMKIGRGRKRMSNTFLDIILELIRFNRDNQNFFFFVLRNMHSGFNKINWNRTISTTSAIIQDNSPVYLNPVNKKRQINFDEELLIIFFSILNYVGDHYGFPKNINCNFDLITGKRFEAFMKNSGKLGKARLMQIKYKYFSDKALVLWELCYAFFENVRQVSINSDQKEYLLVKNFNVVFEAIIDELIGDNNIPAGLKEQEDGKRVDHLYTYQSLTSNEDNKPIYYIGDSKYYKQGRDVEKKSVYKQFTYARNVIQWNLNLFMKDDKEDEDLQYDKRNFGHVPKLRDDVTEGYNIIPNFFISARLNKELDYNDAITPCDSNEFKNEQFENRLFDRDTLLVCKYDVNFLYVVSLYARNNASQKAEWKETVRKRFREEIQKMLENKYTFYAMTPREGVDAEIFMKENFQHLLGKVFTPYNISGPQQYYSLALDNDKKYAKENDFILDLVESGFYHEICELGKDPRDVLPTVAQPAKPTTPTSLLTTHHIQRYPNQHFLIGCYHSKEQFDWIMGKNDKGTNLYNVRLKKRGSVVRDGALVPSFLAGLDVKFVILYEHNAESKGYCVFHVHHHATMDEERMRKAWYPDPKGNYFCYIFDEEVELSKGIDLLKIIADSKLSADYVDGAPIVKTGDELMKYLI